jgi:hypothetical protein
MWPALPKPSPITAPLQRSQRCRRSMIIVPVIVVPVIVVPVIVVPVIVVPVIKPSPT